MATSAILLGFRTVSVLGFLPVSVIHSMSSMLGYLQVSVLLCGGSMAATMILSGLSASLSDLIGCLYGSLCLAILSDPVEELHDNLYDSAGILASLSDPVLELLDNLCHPTGLKASFCAGLFASLSDTLGEIHAGLFAVCVILFGSSMTSVILLGFRPALVMGYLPV